MSARTSRGFTLVEVLVALVVMALMATMAWQGVDGIARARSTSEGQVERMLRLESVVAQWDQDLAALHDANAAPVRPIEFDGSTLRMTRRTESGVQVVAWSLRDGAWLRWAAPPVTTRRGLRERWEQSKQLLPADPGQLRAIEGVAQWRLYLYRGNAWTNAQSSASTTSDGGAVRETLPQGVRCVLAFAPGSGTSGELTRDVYLAVQR